MGGVRTVQRPGVRARSALPSETRSLHRARRSFFRLTALVGADLGRRGYHPALALARVLAHAAIARTFARALALAAIATDAFHAGLAGGISRGALREDRRGQKHCTNRRCQNRTRKRLAIHRGNFSSPLWLWAGHLGPWLVYVHARPPVQNPDRPFMKFDPAPLY
jgi:hypothetical protein